MTLVDRATQLPRFAYLHQPEGSPPDLRFRLPGIAPTGTHRITVNAKGEYGREQAGWMILEMVS